MCLQFTDEACKAHSTSVKQTTRTIVLHKSSEELWPLSFSAEVEQHCRALCHDTEAQNASGESTVQCAVLTQHRNATARLLAWELPAEERYKESKILALTDFTHSSCMCKRGNSYTGPITRREHQRQPTTNTDSRDKFQGARRSSEAQGKEQKAPARACHRPPAASPSTAAAASGKQYLDERLC